MSKDESSLNVHLRPATIEDAAAVADVLILARLAFMPYAPSAHSDPELRTWVHGHLVPGGGVLVAEHEGVVVGVMSTSCAAGVHWIDQMMVRPSHVDVGIGSRLLEHALETLARPIRLCTFQANGGARRFYERHGFVAIEFTDGLSNEEHCPDVLYELAAMDRRGV